jgi:hypothetical protein
MRIDNNINNNADLRALLEENLKISKEVLAISKSVKKHTAWLRIGAILRLLVIVVPTVLAFIYLPPYIEKFTAIFNSLYSGDQFNILERLKGADLNGAAAGANIQGIDINTILQEINKRK